MITKLRLTMDGLPKTIFCMKLTTREQHLLQPHPKKISMTYTLKLNILPRPLPMPLLKPLASNSLVLSNHEKIALWVWPNNVWPVKRLYLV